jgi:pimeloyl-ACP methyl ester carboxylesterase
MSVVVLVAGGNLGAWAWERVTPNLAAAGHDVYPLTLTGLGDRAHLGSTATTLSTHATDIAAAIEVAGLRDAVLVLHSYAGAPGTLAVSRVADRIARVVYLAGVLPQPGKTLFEIAPPGVEEIIQQFADREGDGWLIPFMNDDILDAYYGKHGLVPADRAWLRDRAAGQPIGTYRDPAPDDLSAASALPRTYIICAGDPAPLLAPGTPGYDVITLDSGHWPMVTEPVKLARLLDDIARQ